MRLELERCVVRSWAHTDLTALARHANDRDVWLQLRDRFPHPYRVEDGERFLAHISQQPAATAWAIEVDGEAAGGIGLELGTDVERVSAEIGYWLGRSLWGRGIVADAARGVTAEAWRTLPLTRIFAMPFADNPRSVRVLEKAGYVREGYLPRSAVKDGRVRDQLLYGAYKA